MTSDKFNRMHDHWLQSGNPADDEDDPICEVCGAFMKYEQDVDVDENGKAYISGGSWHCDNENCGEEPDEEETDG